MEFVSGYRDEFLDFAALLFGWFHKFVAERGAVGYVGFSSCGSRVPEHRLSSCGMRA